MTFSRSAHMLRSLALLACAAPLCLRADLASKFQKEIEPIFETYCYDCHGGGLKKGDLALDQYQTIESMIHDREIWKRIREHIDFRLMPPPDEDLPDDAARKKLIDWIDDAVFPVDPNHPDPGHVTLHRLNKAEYRNTIRDLLGVKIDVDDILPPDDSGYGFDNIGEVLTLSPVHLERYLEAARLALDKALDFSPPHFPEKIVNGGDLKGSGSPSSDGLFFTTDGEADKELKIKAGRYKIRVIAGADASGGEVAKMVLRIDGEEKYRWDVTNPTDRLQTYEAEIQVDDKGRNPHFSLAFTNDFYDEKIADPKQRDRNLLIRQLRIEGPLDGPMAQRSGTHRNVFNERDPAQSDDGYMLDVLDRFARRAFRRPAREGEIERYLAFGRYAKAEGKPVEIGIRNALEAMLISPAFLFREEDGIGPSEGGKQLISEHSLAARLSYFLWSTMPDEQLSSLAGAGKLRENLASEIARMIADPKAAAFTSNFVGQWLQLRNLSSTYPSSKKFPSYYEDQLAGLMRVETEMLFSYILEQNLPVITLLNANYTFINDKLARNYGIPGIEGGEFRKVSLQGTARRGIFGHGSFLTLTSYPNRTSPVLRGQYILENILHTPAPPPPPNIPQLIPPDGAHEKSLSLRQQMEKHRSDPACASCHALMDPLGFAMENFDAIGRWRDQENDLPVNASGTLVSGQSFSGPEELIRILSKDRKDEFQHALAVKLLTYAIGRGVDWYDRPAVDSIVAKAGADDGRFVTMIQAVVTSVPFQYRRNSTP